MFGIMKVAFQRLRQDPVRGVRFAALAVALAAGLFASCRGMPLKEGVGITLDSEFEDWTRTTLKIDAQRFSELQLSVPESDPYFYRRIFKTADFSGAVAFIDERVDYLIAPGYFPSRLISPP